MGRHLLAEPTPTDAGREQLRVLHVSQPTDAGVARVVLALVAHQVRAGLSVTLACPTSGPLSGRAARAGATVVPWEAVRDPARGVLAESAALRDVVGRVAPDVVHLHSSKAGLVGRLTVRGRVPTVFQPHAWADQAARGGVRVAARAWERLAHRWADVTVCGSEAEARHGAGLGATRTEVVPNGVDPVEFAPRERGAARSRLGVPPHARVAVCVGRLCEQKGQDELLDVWRGLVADPGTTMLVLVGGGPAEERLREAARDLPVRFVTDCDDPRDWYAASDVVVAPSRWEGAALAPLEAMSMGRAVVGYDVGGLGSVVSSRGAVVTPGDRAGLAQAVHERLTDASGADSEGVVNRATVEQHFDSRSTAWNITALTAGLAGGLEQRHRTEHVDGRRARPAAGRGTTTTREGAEDR